MYKIKQKPEDFVVKEISNVEISKEVGDNASFKYLYFKMKKRNKNTLDVVKEISRVLRIKEKQIGFAGSKDKYAVTEQTISITGVGKERVERLRNDNWSLEFLGGGTIPISLGDLEGNYFEIVIRDLDKEQTENVKPISFIENYYDEQRFSQNNVAIGKNIVKKEFLAAAKLVDDNKVQDFLAKKPNDAIGALKKVPIRLLRMYVNAYQSYLWNETVVGLLKDKVVKEIDYSQGKLVFVNDYNDLEVPLVGFSETNDQNIKQIMNKEEINHRDFVIKQIPELSLEGEVRKVCVEVKNFKVLVKGDDWIKVSFTLPKGSYATMVIKRLFG